MSEDEKLKEGIGTFRKIMILISAVILWPLFLGMACADFLKNK